MSEAAIVSPHLGAACTKELEAQLEAQAIKWLQRRRELAGGCHVGSVNGDKEGGRHIRMEGERLLSPRERARRRDDGVRAFYTRCAPRCA